MSSATSSVDRRPLFLYLGLTFLFSSFFYYQIIHSGHLAAAGGWYVVGLMWSPGTAAMLTCVILRRPLRSLGWKWGKWRYQAASYLIPLGYATAVYVTVWITSLGRFNPAATARMATRFGLGGLPSWAMVVVALLFDGTVGVLLSCLTALGEEIGWRGFLVPELAKHTNFTRTALISGAIWSVWHYPVLLFADYNAGTEPWYGLPCFTVMVIGIAFVFAWMRLKSGSLWTGVLLHASHNLFIQSFFDRVTSDTGRTHYVIGEFGAGLAIAAVCCGIYFRSRRGELPSAAEKQPDPMAAGAT
jgi:membrane protease YdiL (CAAX protease family)